MNRSVLRICVGLSLFASACGTTRGQKQKATDLATAQIGLGGIAADINRTVQATARDITSTTDDRETKRVLIKWQIGTMESTRRALQLADPRWTFVNLWTMLYQTNELVASGDVKELDATQQKQVTTALTKLQGMLAGRAGSVLTEKWRFER